MEEANELGEEIQKLPKKYQRVRNKAPAAVQITAEQLLREATDRRLEQLKPKTAKKVEGAEEIEAEKMAKRKFFEDRLRKSRDNVSNWLRYARFEESMNEIARARSIYERTLELNYQQIPVWLKYIEMELRHKQVNHARNLFDRAVVILPMANQFWFKYVYMEEVLNNIGNVRMIYERWLEWQPPEQTWLSYIKMELRYKEVERARFVFERFLAANPQPKNWIRFAKFERKLNLIDNARLVYEKGIEYFFGDGDFDEDNLNFDVDELQTLVLSFARFEESVREYDRARAIYCNLKFRNNERIESSFVEFQKRRGQTLDQVELSVFERCKKALLVKNDKNIKSDNDYDDWFDLINLLLTNLSFTSEKEVCEVFERAVSATPIDQNSKESYRRYVYLWLLYANYCEVHLSDLNKAEKVYKTCMEVLPSKKFTFSKVLIKLAEFYIRQNNLQKTRKMLGRAIGSMNCGRKLYYYYIELESKLKNYDRCRKIFEKLLEKFTSDVNVWCRYVMFEVRNNCVERAREILQIGLDASDFIENSEILWKYAIDICVDLNEFEGAIALFRNLLDKTKHCKVWISLAKFYLYLDNLSECRKVFDEARAFFKNEPKNESLMEQRFVLLHAVHEFEEKYGDDKTKEEIARMLPKKTLKRNDLYSTEEFVYEFPEDSERQPTLSLLEKAYAWQKKTQT